MSSVIQIDGVSKLYRLGSVGRGSLQDDLKRWWAKVRKQEDPFQKLGEKNIRNIAGDSDYIWALKNISLTIKEGEILGIIGNNGAGKSTLLKLLSRITSPTFGTLKIKGRTASLLEVGTGFHPELTGMENILLNGTILGMTTTEIKRKLDEIIDFSGVERYINTPIKRYSSGMYVRLAFSVAAFLKSNIFFIDEVLAVGDFRFQKKCLNKIVNLKKSGSTIIFVSHNLPSVQAICSRGICLDNGSIKFEGDIQDVINDYLNIESFVENGNNKKKYKKMKYAQLIEITTNDNNRNSNNSLIIMNGKKIVFKVKIDAFVIKNNIMVSLGINDHLGSRICVFHSQLSDISLNMKKGVQEYLCEVKKFPLVEGNYTIDVKLYDDNGESILFEKNAKELFVQNGNYFGSGIMPEREWSGSLLIDHNWYN